MTNPDILPAFLEDNFYPKLEIVKHLMTTLMDTAVEMVLELWC